MIELLVRSTSTICGSSFGLFVSLLLSSNSDVPSENTDNSSSVSPADSWFSSVKTSGVSSSDTSSGFPEVNSSANTVWGSILAEHNASARIPANNFFFT